MASSKASEAPPQGTTSEESVRTLKKLVRSYLCRSEFASKVRTALSCPVEDAQRAEGSVTVTRRRTVEEAVAVLKNEGFVEELTKLAMMDAKRTSEEERSSATTNSDGGSCLMKVRVSGVEGLDDAATISGEGRAVATKVCIMWCGQRKWSVHKAAVGERIRGTNDTHFFNIPSKCSKNGYAMTSAFCPMQLISVLNEDSQRWTSASICIDVACINCTRRESHRLHGCSSSFSYSTV